MRGLTVFQRKDSLDTLDLLTKTVAPTSCYRSFPGLTQTFHSSRAR